MIGIGTGMGMECRQSKTKGLDSARGRKRRETKGRYATGTEAERR